VISPGTLPAHITPDKFCASDFQEMQRSSG
jgi:hypothetical protein